MRTTKTLGAIASTTAGAAAVAALLLAGGCAVDQPVGISEFPGLTLAMSDNAVTNVPKITGSVEIVWMGGNGAGAPDVENRAFAEFEGFEMPAGMAPRGSFHFLVYRVTPEGLVLHREIEAAAEGVVIDPVSHKAWMTAQVIADTKQCMSGGGCDGHDGGDGGMGGPGGCTDCGGDTGHDGGCSGSDGGTHDDGGCSGSDGGTHDDGGCAGGSGGMGGMEGGSGGMEGGSGGTEGGCSGSDGTTHTDGGCSGSDGTTHTDGGCSGSDGGTHDDGGCAGGGGSGGMGYRVSGSGSRVGQYLAIKMHDGDTPATEGDGITWKWFAADNPNRPLITALDVWPHLCKKTIVGGNLVIHLPKTP